MGKNAPPVKNEEKSSGAQLYFFIYKMLQRREELLPEVKEFENLDKTLRDYFQGVPSFSIGKYKIRGNWEKTPGGKKIWKSNISKGE